MTEHLLSQRDGRLLRLTLNRPEKRNALNAALCSDLTAAMAAAEHDPDIGAILLMGNGKGFSAGMDLDEALTCDPGTLADVQERLFTAYSWLTTPLIAAVHGAALAGGTGLAANAHITVASEDARFGLTEVRIGLWPFVIFRSMVAAIGERKSVELALSGRIFSAKEARENGLIHAIFPPEELESRAVEIATAIANSSWPAISTGLAFVQKSRTETMAEIGQSARTFRKQICEGEDFQERVRRFRSKT